jgi:superfamily II DNA or RNA helicase
MTIRIQEIDALLSQAEKELASLESRRTVLIEDIQKLQQQRKSFLIPDAAEPDPEKAPECVTNSSPSKAKISLFMDLFRGRQDVYPRRFESRRTGKSGYQPACRNEWKKGRCRKPRVKCANCNYREFQPVTEVIIRNHLLGRDPEKGTQSDFTIGVYPLLPDETCWFLVADFDKTTWKEDAIAFLETCKTYNVPAALERSRSGNGGHIWIFFSEPISAPLARQLGAFVLTETMERRPEIGLDSYDRFFPSQDTIPTGGFGNLIALPLQNKARELGNSLFLDQEFSPYLDQWKFLANVRRMKPQEAEILVEEAVRRGQVVGVRMHVTDEDENEPWTAPPSRQPKPIPVTGPVPETIELVLNNQIYVAKEGLSPALRNRLIRIAAFQNPEFYKAQAMRFPTFDKPRIISCCEDFPGHIGIPRGCLHEVLALLRSLNVSVNISDQRFSGNRINIFFKGRLTPEQQTAAENMLSHETGILAATTAFGKTVVGCNLIAERGVNTLVLVHRRQLLDQWMCRLHEFLDLEPEGIGQIGGGRRNPTGRIDVAIIQSLSKKGVVDDIVAEYGHLIVDECHHVSARSFEIVARQTKARYVTGLSATVTRKDGHHPIIFMHCGPIRHTVDHRKQAAARPFDHRVITRNTSFSLPPSIEVEKSRSIQEIYSALIADERRNEMIIRDVLEAIKDGRSPVVLTERREHLEHLAGRLDPIIRNVIVMKGGASKKQRKLIAETISQIPDDAERLILATGRYLGEGFDDARLDTLFLTLPVSWRGTIAQYAGRLHRLHETKRRVIIYDYVDFHVPVLVKMYERRCQGYKSLGYELESP